MLHNGSNFPAKLLSASLSRICPDYNNPTHGVYAYKD